MQALLTTTLLVDDNKTFLSAVLCALQQAKGIEVVGCAADGLEALDLISTLQPELVILDISMPRLSGLDLARQLHKVAGAPSIIMLSMHDSQEYRQAAADVGVRAFINKDNFMSELVPLLNQLYFDKQNNPPHKALS